MRTAPAQWQQRLHPSSSTPHRHVDAVGNQGQGGTCGMTTSRLQRRCTMNPHRISPRLATWSARRQWEPEKHRPQRGETLSGSSAPKKHNAHAQVGEQNYEERDVNRRLTQNSAGGVRCQSPSESLEASRSVRTCTHAGRSVGGDGRGSGSVGVWSPVRKECGSSRRG